jgi:hypothetical protein
VVTAIVPISSITIHAIHPIFVAIARKLSMHRQNSVCRGKMAHTHTIIIIISYKIYFENNHFRILDANDMVILTIPDKMAVMTYLDALRRALTGGGAPIVNGRISSTHTHTFIKK